MSTAAVVAGRAADRLVKRMRRATGRNRPLEGPTDETRRALRAAWQYLLTASTRRDRLALLLWASDEVGEMVALALLIAAENDTIQKTAVAMDVLEAGTSAP